MRPTAIERSAQATRPRRGTTLNLWTFTRAPGPDSASPTGRAIPSRAAASTGCAKPPRSPPAFKTRQAAGCPLFYRHREAGASAAYLRSPLEGHGGRKALIAQVDRPCGSTARPGSAGQAGRRADDGDITDSGPASRAGDALIAAAEADPKVKGLPPSRGGAPSTPGYAGPAPARTVTASGAVLRGSASTGSTTTGSLGPPVRPRLGLWGLTSAITPSRAHEAAATSTASPLRSPVKLKGGRFTAASS